MRVWPRLLFFLTSRNAAISILLPAIAPVHQLQLFCITALYMRLFIPHFPDLFRILPQARFIYTFRWSISRIGVQIFPRLLRNWKTFYWKDAILWFLISFQFIMIIKSNWELKKIGFCSLIFYGNFPIEVVALSIWRNFIMIFMSMGISMRVDF